MKRSLTSGEIALAKTLFGDSIDYPRVRLHDKRILPPGFQRRHQAVAKGDHISFPRSACADDFSRETDAFKQSVFIHELVHVWQHQNKVLSTPMEAAKALLRHKFNYQKAYLYRLEAGRDLLQYGFEQQAAMIQDYFLLTRHHEPGSYKNRRIDAAEPGLREKYEQVLARFLKNSAYAFNNINAKPRRKPGSQIPPQ